MPFPTHSVNGVPMADALGRWHEHSEMSVFPAHPGLRASALSVLGVGGEYPLSQAPIEPQDYVLHMVINAVAENGARPATYAERLVALNTNVQQLMRVFQVAGMTQGGWATITRHLSDTRQVHSSGRLEASVEAEFDPGADWLEMKFIFRLSYGTWRGNAFVQERVSGTSSATQFIKGLAASTAPIDQLAVTLTGPFTSLQVTNQHGNGFRYANAVAAGQAVTVNCDRWSVTNPYAKSDPETAAMPTNLSYLGSPHLHQVGQASGTALTLVPDARGVPLLVSGTGRGTGTSVHVHTTEAFF